jgi:hypothetical protein
VHLWSAHEPHHSDRICSIAYNTCVGSPRTITDCADTAWRWNHVSQPTTQWLDLKPKRDETYFEILLLIDRVWRKPLYDTKEGTDFPFLGKGWARRLCILAGVTHSVTVSVSSFLPFCHTTPLSEQLHQRLGKPPALCLLLRFHVDYEFGSHSFHTITCAAQEAHTFFYIPRPTHITIKHHIFFPVERYRLICVDERRSNPLFLYLAISHPVAVVYAFIDQNRPERSEVPLRAAV